MLRPRTVRFGTQPAATTERRDRLGTSYLVERAEAMKSMAPVVATRPGP